MWYDYCKTIFIQNTVKSNTEKKKNCVTSNITHSTFNSALTGIRALALHMCAPHPAGQCHGPQFALLGYISMTEGGHMAEHQCQH